MDVEGVLQCPVADGTLLCLVRRRRRGARGRRGLWGCCHGQQADSQTDEQRQSSRRSDNAEQHDGDVRGYTSTLEDTGPGRLASVAFSAVGLATRPAKVCNTSLAPGMQEQASPKP